MSEYDKQNIKAIISGNGDWFTAKLLHLIRDSDMSNRRRLFQVYPEEVHAVNVFHFGKEAAEHYEEIW